MDNLHKLWDTIPNTSSYPSAARYQPTSYSSAQSYGQNDTVYSFNQYSSYYASGSLWKKNNNIYASKQKPMWQDDVTYNKYLWARGEKSNVLATYNNYSNLSYGYSPARYAQEVC